jgi:mono/diheme cytochrome c family protein
VAGKKQKNQFTSASEVLLWLLFVALVFPAAFAGYAVGHYTSLGKPPKTVISTTTVGSTSPTTTPTSTSTPGTTTSATTTTSSSGGNAAAGKTVFTDAGCAGCHTFEAAGATGTFGPNLDDAIAADAQADGDMDIDAFIRESITNPDAYHADGYSGGMAPNGGASLTPKQLDDLVAFISANTQQ